MPHRRPARERADRRLTIVFLDRKPNEYGAAVLRERASSATVDIIMSELKIDRSDPTLLHDQVAAEISLVRLIESLP